MSRTKPKALRHGSRIGVVAPASPCSREITGKYCYMLSACGFDVVLGESVLSQRGYLAGNDKVRANDINSMFSDSDIDAIFCLRGGYGCSRILEMLDLKMIKANPKIFLGFSDITVLHNAFNQFSNLITFHGPSVSNCEWGSDDYRFLECMRVLKGASCNLKASRVYNSKSCGGEICGGNLTLVESLIGTKYQVDPENKILLLEDVGEKNYSIDRRLNHLRQTGYFKQCRAVVLGNFTEGDQNVLNDNIPLAEIIEDLIVPCGKPVLVDAEFGHIDINPTIAMGANALILGNRVYIPSSVAI